ncbi:class I SAM-dependent DNA methyltransferase [Labrys neptuniae]
MSKTRSSGDAVADRRFAYAMEYRAGGDTAAAAELMVQALDQAPGWAAGWLMLGELYEMLERREPALAAYRRALARDPADEAGAGARLARLGERPADGAMTPAHVAALFDDYAPRFERSLVGDLSYRGPTLLRAALEGLGRRGPFARALDLGCGTGLAGEVFAPLCRAIIGVDLSAAMLREARRKQLYGALEQGDILPFLARQEPAGADLVLAADVFVYLGDLSAIFDAVARALAPGGVFAFTAQRQDGPAPFVLGHDMRYAHSLQAIESWAATAGLGIAALDQAWARVDRGMPVPGLVAVLER